jgi:hypothetical protein
LALTNNLLQRYNLIFNNTNFQVLFCGFKQKTQKKAQKLRFFRLYEADGAAGFAVSGLGLKLGEGCAVLSRPNCQ